MTTADTKFDQALTTLLRKAIRPEIARAIIPGGLDFCWSGGGQAIDVTQCDPVLLEVPFDSRIVWVHAFAMDGSGTDTPATVEFDVRLRGSATTLYGVGDIPILSNESYRSTDLTDWEVLGLLTGDQVVARIVSLTTGSPTLIVLTIQLRPTEVPVGEEDVEDATTAEYTDASGATYTYRS